MPSRTISDRDYGNFQRFIFDEAGITLSPAKKPWSAGAWPSACTRPGWRGMRNISRCCKAARIPPKCRWRSTCSPPTKPISSANRGISSLLRSAAQQPGATSPFRVWSAARLQRRRGLQHRHGPGGLPRQPAFRGGGHRHQHAHAGQGPHRPLPRAARLPDPRTLPAALLPEGPGAPGGNAAGGARACARRSASFTPT